MSTIEQLTAIGQLRRVKVRLHPREQVARRLYATLRFLDWFERELPLIRGSVWGDNVPARDQTIDLLRRFISGQALSFDRQFHALAPSTYGVWEMKTGDVRVFGWFPQFDCFIASTGGDATSVKKDALGYHCKRMWAVSERNELPLDEPKFIAGSNPIYVISS